MASTEIQIYEKVKSLEREISEVKISLLKAGIGRGTAKKPVSLEGVWEGVDITEEDIEASQKSLFPDKCNLL